MNACALAIRGDSEYRYEQIIIYLSQDEEYWIKNDTWDIRDAVFEEICIIPKSGHRKQICFSTYKNDKFKNEAKFYIAYSLKNRRLSAGTVLNHYRMPLEHLGGFMETRREQNSFRGFEFNRSQMELYLRNSGIYTGRCGGEPYRYFRNLWESLTSFIIDYYDEREETEKDIWHAAHIPGVRASAAEKSGKKPSISFIEIPGYYRETVKRFVRRLVTRRSWSYSSEMLVYIRYFFNTFYSKGYQDGFFEKLTRKDIEKYMEWVSADHKNNNATYRSKTVSYVRQFIDYIQLAEYPQAPKTEVDRLIHEDDYPKRERISDTLEKVKYIPAPVREQLDAVVSKLEPAEMVPIYILLRETGWRGTDILNLRYGNCLEYFWNAKEQRYVSYLCGEITKTGIPVLKIPVRNEVAEMVRKLAEEASIKSTKDNNPDGYLFNTYEGRNVGMPISKSAFVKAVQTLIDEKGICGADGSHYHFKTHALRHTRAMEYIEQGMPIGVIQQILGHCSLQMTLHYAKVSENTLYEKWKETEKLNLFHVGDKPPRKSKLPEGVREEGVHYEYIRKSLDAVRVPFGTCFKPAKLACRQQIAKCLECPSFCSTNENVPEYEQEIRRVQGLIEISITHGRSDWEKKNMEYLDLLKKMLERILKDGTVHKNSDLREEH